ncbi:uncharacterized protein BDZ99DRAFT_501347 [Mytilinidion resinicola]|uniref:Uncharacterized protein n=1 Tax=Mytilinidion resinicola TaxID=574789 RepID=A0A6A6YEQ5_9PEZI|nr:uncharacterized protein BDZ99DRAFT_501347 [Mytilinidion resinicola]KAF2806535.1 hypothetical protein BDZ99DRAFT_501347 [Mytilinidion resinicola]
MSTSVQCPTSYDVTAPVGPLTTVFTPPYGCSGFDCMPSGYSDSYMSSQIGYYSPAICPFSFTVDCERYSNLCNGIQGPTEAPGETVVRCCPSSYYCGNEDTFCVSSNTAMTYVSSVYGIQIRWKSSDLSILETNPLTPGLSIHRTTSASTMLSTSSTTSPLTGAISSTTSQHSALDPSTSLLTSVLPIVSAPAASNSLSTGTKAGIGVGSAAIVFLALACSFILFRRHKRSKGSDSNHDNHGPAPETVQTTKATSNALDQKMSELRGSSSTPASPYSPQTPIISKLNPHSPVPSHAVLSGEPSFSKSDPRPPSLGAISDDGHLQQLKQEHARVQEQKNRLKQLQQLDEQEENLGRLINEREAGVLTPTLELDGTQILQELPGHETK